MDMLEQRTRVTASAETLMRQAPYSVSEYLKQAVIEIDEVFGSGYAKQHPELVGAFIQASAIEMQCSCGLQGLQEIAEALDSLNTTANAFL